MKTNNFLVRSKCVVAITGQPLQDVRGMRKAIERGEAALGSLRSNRFVVDHCFVFVVVVIIIIIIVIFICDSVKSSSLQTYISTSHKKMQRVVQSLENFDSIYNPELMIFAKSNFYLILIIVTENIREEIFSCNRRMSWMNR